MYILTEILGVVAELFTYHLFVQGIFDRKRRSPGVWLATYGILGGILLFLSFVENASFLRLSYCLVVFGIIAKVFFDMTVIQMFFTSFSFGCLYVLTDVFSITLGNMMGVDVNIIMTYGNIRAVFIIFVHTVLFLIVMLVLAMTKRKRNAVSLPFMLSIIPGSIAGILLGIYFCLSVQNTGEDIPVTIMFIAAGLLYMNILIVFYAEQLQESNTRRHEMELAEQHYQMQQRYYEQLRNDQNETRAMFHDINKYLQAMQALAGDSNTEQAKEVLTQAQSIFNSLGSVIDVGNSVISTLLNEYLQKAEENSIQITFDVSVPENIGITAIDFYVILGNTLDNAMEAVSLLPEDKRQIHLQLRTFHEILFYQIQNPFLPEHIGKKTGKNHGFGLKNVKRCVEKYHGDITISQEDSLFSVALRLNTTVCS